MNEFFGIGIFFLFEFFKFFEMSVSDRIEATTTYRACVIFFIFEEAPFHE